MGDGYGLEDLRQEAHAMGIKGNAKMTEDELREAIAKVNKGEKPQMPVRQPKP